MNLWGDLQAEQCDIWRNTSRHHATNVGVYAATSSAAKAAAQKQMPHTSLHHAAARVRGIRGRVRLAAAGAAWPGHGLNASSASCKSGCYHVAALSGCTGVARAQRALIGGKRPHPPQVTWYR